MHRCDLAGDKIKVSTGTLGGVTALFRSDIVLKNVVDVDFGLVPDCSLGSSPRLPWSVLALLSAPITRDAPRHSFHQLQFAVAIRLFSCDSLSEVRLASLLLLMFCGATWRACCAASRCVVVIPRWLCIRLMFHTVVIISYGHLLTFIVLFW